jgi:hypothetical protein
MRWSRPLLTLPGCIIPGVVIFVALTYLLVSVKVSSPVAITFSALVFGLTRYYAHSDTVSMDNNSNSVSNSSDTSIKRKNAEGHNQKPSYFRCAHAFYLASLNGFAFLAIYATLLLIAAFISNPNSELFVPWNEITPIQIIQLVAAIALAFFLPGYSLVTILDKNQELQPLPKLLLGYIFSMLITGLTAYITASAGIAVSDAKMLIVGINALLLTTSILWFVKNLRSPSEGISRKLISEVLHSYGQQIYGLFSRIAGVGSSLIVFLSLFALIIVYTYQLYDGKIVGDQWFHLGRSLIFTSGSYDELIGYDVDSNYPPLFSSLLSAFSVLSGFPSVNAYASIHFLNIMPVFAFYYFFTNWVPARWKRAALMASVLFMLSSGFGWILVLDRALGQDGPMSPESSLTTLHSAGLRTSDVRSPTTFLNVGHPDFSTPLLIVALPAGFSLIGLVRQTSLGKLGVIMVVMGLSYSGIVFHDEFYLFVIVVSILPLAFNLGQKNLLYAALLASISLILITDTLSPGKYFTVREVLGIPLLALVLVFILLAWTIYYTRLLNRILPLQKKAIALAIKGLKIRSGNRIRQHNVYSGTSRLLPRLLLISSIAYLYLFTFLVWGELSDRDVRIQVRDFGQSDVPWYMYPMKFGITGLLGLAFILSYVFKKYEKEVFVFGIIALVAFLTGPYYQEHRFGKYIMSAMVGFASLLIYRLIVFLYRYRLNTIFCGILLGSIITLSSLSIVFFLSYNALSLEYPHLEIALSKRDFPTHSELQLFDFLRRNYAAGQGIHNVAIPSDEYDLQRGLITKLEGFSSIPRAKLLESQYTLNASTIEAFNDLISYADVGFIIVPADDIAFVEWLSYPIRFALDNFPKVYEDDNYVVLDVPANLTKNSSTQASSENEEEVALVYDKQKLWPGSSSPSPLWQMDNKEILEYNNDTFKELEKYSKLIKTSVDDQAISGNGIRADNNQDSTITLYGDKRRSGVTIWSINTDNSNQTGYIHPTNYIEAKLRVIDENKTDNHAGIKWIDGTSEYYASLRNDKLELEEIRPTTIINESERGSDSSSRDSGNENNDNNNSDNKNRENKDVKRYFQNLEVNRKQGIWYTLAVAVTNNTTKVYVDNTLAIQAPRINSDISNNNIFHNISKVGIKAVGNVAEFQPIVLGNIPSSELQSDSELYQQELYQHYYPLSSIALSDIKYDTFAYGDYSAFAKKYVILTSDPLPTSTSSDSQKDENATINKYLEYATNGGTLIVMNTDNDSNFDGIFSRLFSIVPSSKSMKFDGIMDIDDYKAGEDEKEVVNEKEESVKQQKEHRYLNISGLVTSIQVRESENTTIDSAYVNNMNKNESSIVAPFAIEKKYGDGKVIFVNAGGYMDALFVRSDNNIYNKSQPLEGLDVAPFLIGLNAEKMQQNIHEDNHRNNITELVDNSKNDNNVGNRSVSSSPAARLIGDLEVSGSIITIESPSLLWPSEERNSGIAIQVGSISHISDERKSPINNGNQNRNSSENTNDNNQEHQTNVDLLNSNYFNNSTDNNIIQLQDLKLYGNYEVIINSTGPLRLPSFPSDYDYITVPIPSGFDMKIRLTTEDMDDDDDGNGRDGDNDDAGNNSNTNTNAVVAVLANSTEEHNRTQSIKVANGEINFRNITIVKINPLEAQNNRSLSSLSSSEEEEEASSPSLSSLPLHLVLKSPEITITNGVANFTRLYDPDKLGDTLSLPPAEVSGNMSLKLSHIDYNYEPYKLGTKAQYITFFNWLDVNNTKMDILTDNEGIQIPGDISQRAKLEGVQVPWLKAMTSYNNLVLIVSIVITTAVIGAYALKRMQKYVYKQI